MAYDNTNSFILFKNDRKQKDTHPDYTGTFTDAEGNEYYADMWIKKGQKGEFLTGKVKPKGERKAAPRQQEREQPDI